MAYRCRRCHDSDENLDSSDETSSSSEDVQWSDHVRARFSLHVGPVLRFCNCFRPATIALFTVAVGFAIPAALYRSRGGFDGYLALAWKTKGELWCYLGMVVTQSMAAFFAATLLQVSAESKHLRLSAMYAGVLWLCSLASLLQWTFQPEASNFAHSFAGLVIHAVGDTLDVLASLSLALLLLSRVEAVEASMERHYGAGVMRRLIIAMMCAAVSRVLGQHVSAAVLWSAPAWLHDQSWQAPTALLATLWTACYIFFYIGLIIFALLSVQTVIVLHAPRRALRRAPAKFRRIVEEDMGWAVRMVRVQYVGTLLCCGSFVVHKVLHIISRVNSKNKDAIFPPEARTDAVAGMATYFVQSVGAWFLSGAWEAGAAGGAGDGGGECWRRCRMAQEAYAPHPDARYQAKVQELAARAISLGKLLDFYGQLGTPGCMPHYTPDLHTTNDVVRGAIIPMSKATGAAYATTMMGGAPTYPQKMVTHNWGNLFRDLVAAIVADATGDAEFVVIACLLDGNLHYLKKLLADKEALDLTYWVCAFSVAQHIGICGANPRGDRDPVTGRPHPVCDCSRPKAFNETEPTTTEGRSIPCEMNKFSEMIAFLADTQRDFGQVIAVDQEFNLFSRCWCVAEAAECSALGVPQQIKIKSRRALEEHEESIQNLRIERMQGSRPQDVLEILAKIPCQEEFNRHIQDMFFNKATGLISAWRDADSTLALRRIGRLASLLEACDADIGRERSGAAGLVP